jgi:hypothetical protein
MTGGTSNGKLGLADGNHHAQPMQVYLSKPAGQREGPFTVDQINHDLATKKYKDTDYWAWYDGLSEWVPLHAVPGVRAPGRPQPAPAQAPEPKKVNPPQARTQNAASTFSGTQPGALGDEDIFTRAKEPAKQPAKPSVPERAAEPVESAGRAEPADEVIFRQANTAPKPQPAESAESETQVGSGLPFPALEQIFIFTTGEGRGVMQSPAVAGMLQDVVGEELSVIRSRVGRDIIGRCDFGERLRRDGAIPEAAWRAMATLKPEVVRLAREGNYRACVRTFTTGAKEVVALFLFYNKEKM